MGPTELWRPVIELLICPFQADIVPELAPCYESEDETMGRRNKVASDLHLQRNKRGTPLYSKEDIREQYCITSKQLDVLERARGSGLFGCLSNYHVSSLPACSCYVQTNIMLLARHCTTRRISESSSASRSPLWSSGPDPEVPGFIPGPTSFLRSSGSGTGFRSASWG
jgi:hypothetical protein